MALPKKSLEKQRLQTARGHFFGIDLMATMQAMPS
jgi:hypothetical protein